MYRTSDKSAAIKEIKKYLYAIGISVYPSVRRITIDGIYDKETRGAVTDFQRAIGYDATGTVDFKTFTALYNAFLDSKESEKQDRITEGGGFPLSIGDMNEDVRILNVFINELSKIYSSVDEVAPSSYYSTESAMAIEALSRVFMMQPTRKTDRQMMERILYDSKNRAKTF